MRNGRRHLMQSVKQFARPGRQSGNTAAECGLAIQNLLRLSRQLRFPNLSRFDGVRLDTAAI